jgi:hypothetical protein
MSRQAQSTMIKPKQLTLSVVFKTLRDIALTTGASVLPKECL